MNRTVPSGQWPTADLDPVRRLRVVDRVFPGVHLAEREVDVDARQVWAFLADIERSVPRIDGVVQSLRIVGRRPEHLDVLALSWGVPVPFRVRLHYSDAGGSLWMQAPVRSYLVATAVAGRPDGGCRVAHMEGLPWLGRARPQWLARHVRSDLDNLVRLVS